MQSAPPAHQDLKIEKKNKHYDPSQKQEPQAKKIAKAVQDKEVLKCKLGNVGSGVYQKKRRADYDQQQKKICNFRGRR